MDRALTAAEVPQSGSTSAPGKLSTECPESVLDHLRTSNGSRRQTEGKRPEVDESADTPGSVPRPGCPGRGDGHPSTTAVADCLQRSTRVLGRAALGRTLSELAPGGVYLAEPVTWPAGGLLHHRFTLTAVPARPEGCVVHRGGLFSVALSRGSPRVAVGHHPALWSPDVPRRWLPTDATAWPTHPRARIGQPEVPHPPLPPHQS